MKGCLKDGERLWTVEELSAYDGSDQSKGVYLAFLGKVYDVDKGRKHYGPGGSYSIFAAKDASRAYLSGDFSDAELVENIFGLPIESYTAVREWDEFYQSEYDMVGKLQGLFYDSNGCATDQLNEAWALVDQASSSVQEEDDDEKLFPPCNSQWDQNEQRTRLWCSDMSGGAKRDWVGKPRRLYMPKHNVHRCACVKDTGLASTSSVQYADTDHSELKTDNANQGDLNNARVSLFPACDPTAIECIVTEDQLNAK